MVVAAEVEAFPELAGPAAEWEADLESEEFFGRLVQLARRAAASPSLRRVARRAMNAARAAAIGGRILSVAQGLPHEALPPPPPPVVEVRRQDPGAQGPPDPEAWFEWEGGSEAEWEATDGAPATGRLMEHLGHAAATAEQEDEAEAFIGALIPLAARLLPQVGPAITRVAPQLIRGATNVARVLRSSPATRPLVRAVPTIVRDTATTLARQVASGRPVTAQSAVRTLAGHTYRTLQDPRRCVHAYRRSRTLDRAWHRSTPPPMPPGGR